MAIIPRDSKSNSAEDKNIGIEAVIMIFTLVILSNMLISPFIHERLTIPFYVFLAIVCVYLLFPSNRNKGKLGYHRLFVMLKYTAKKANIKRRLGK